MPRFLVWAGRELCQVSARQQSAPPPRPVTVNMLEVGEWAGVVRFPTCSCAGSQCQRRRRWVSWTTPLR